MKLRQMAMTIDGQRIRQLASASQDGETLNLYIYDAIEGDSYDWWTGEKTESETSAAYFGQVLSEHPDVKQINLFVNSRGGSVIEAMGIRAHMLRHPAQKTAYVDGWAASAASFVLTGCDEIVMLTGSMQMLHSMWVLVIGSAKELRKAADDLDRMMAGNKQMYLERAGDKLTPEKLDEMMDAETWLTADECVEYGLADRVMAAAEYKEIKQCVPTGQLTGIIHAGQTDLNPQQKIEPPDGQEPPEDDPAQQEDSKRQEGANFLAALAKAAERKNK
jgi:ATP-dependent Clp protease protease subunit